MKKILWLVVLLTYSTMQAVDYSGTDLISADGFSIAADSTVTMNVPIPVAGAIDANDTGTLSLTGDAYLAANSSFTNGIKLDGQEHTIHLFGNNTLPADKTIEITSSVTIDGHSNKLDFNGCALFINGAEGTTLRLKNMTLYGVKDLVDNASIYFSDTADQKLILENCTVYLTDDYTFAGGALDIEGSVVLVGDYEFIYQAEADCTIKKASSLQLDMHVMFSYEPEDSLATHLKFTDLTSSLVLRGGTLYVPSSIGINLVRGHLVIEHKSYFEQDWDSKTFGSGAGRINLGANKRSDNMAIDVLPGAQLITKAAAINYGQKN
jgi:hypothetical protein